MRAPRRRFICWLAALAGLLDSRSPLGAATVDINPSKDNTLYKSSFNIEASNGAGAYLVTGDTALPPPYGDPRRAVIKFDVAGHLPAGSMITHVSLTLTMSKTISGPQATSLHRLLADWGEGTSVAAGPEGGGGTPTTGDATW